MLVTLSLVIIAIVRSEDDGKPWTPVKKSGTIRQLEAVFVDPQSKALLAVGWDGVIVRMEDTDKTWTSVRSGTTNIIDAVLADPLSKALLAVGWSGTILR